MSESVELTELDILKRDVKSLQETLASVKKAEPTSATTSLVVDAIKKAEGMDSFLSNIPS